MIGLIRILTSRIPGSRPSWSPALSLAGSLGVPHLLCMFPLSGPVYARFYQKAKPVHLVQETWGITQDDSKMLDCSRERKPKCCLI